MPRWKPENLRRHHKKRTTEDKGCFEDLLGIAPQVMTELQYDERSEKAYTNAWAEYEAEHWDRRAREYISARAYFVDEQLVVAITDLWRREFITCYHEHFDKPHNVDPSSTASEGQRQLRFREVLEREEKGKMVRKLRRLRGFPR